MYSCLTAKNKENRKSLKFFFHISQRSKVQTKIKRKVLYVCILYMKTTLTGILFSLCGRNCSLLQSFQTSPIAHSASCSCAKGYFSSEARGIPFSAEIECVKPYIHFAIRILVLCFIRRGIPVLFSQLLAAFLMGISRSHISSPYHVVLRITSLLSSSLDGRTSTVAIRRGGYTSL
jgi:hypothetical protein